MNADGVIRVGRRELYERVWTTPMMAVCRDYGISNVGLAKVCKRHKIPCPPRGYWAKKQSGQPVHRTPLPGCPDPALQTVEIHPTPKPVRQAAAFDPDITALLDKVRGLPPITVPAALHNPHPLVRATRAGLEGAQPGTQNLVSPSWNGGPAMAVAVGVRSVPRALRFLDALVKAVERVGGGVEVRTRERNWRCETVVGFCGEEVGLRLRERYQQVPTPLDKRNDPFGARVEYVPTGVLVVDRGPDAFGQPYGEDTTAAGRVEDQIGGILVRLVAEAGRVRIKRREREADRLRWEEQERLRREEAERERAERARVDKLMADTESWRRADAVREYVRVVEHLARDRGINIGEGTELGTWLRWACEQAEKLDPVRRTLDRLTGESRP